MKLSTRTIQILKNFSTINQSLLFRQGDVLRTTTPSKTIMAKATIAENFDTEFAIYDLSRLINTLSLFGDPEIHPLDGYLQISEGSQCVKYNYTDVDSIVTPSKEIKLPQCEINFRMTSANLSSVLKGMNVLGLPELMVVGDGKNIFLSAGNVKQSSGDNYKINVGDTEHEFNIVFRAENVKMMAEDYEVQISSKGIAHLKASDVEYWIAAESSSTFYN
jgi:hypothetical protein